MIPHLVEFVNIIVVFQYNCHGLNIYPSEYSISLIICSINLLNVRREILTYYINCLEIFVCSHLYFTVLHFKFIITAQDQVAVHRYQSVTTFT